MMELECYLFCMGVLSSISDSSVSGGLILGSMISTSEAVVSDTGVVDALSLSVVVVECSLFCLINGCRVMSDTGSDMYRRECWSCSPLHLHLHGQCFVQLIVGNCWQQFEVDWSLPTNCKGEHVILRRCYRFPLEFGP